MAYEFRFPDVGEGITEGEIVRWRVKAGDRVAEHQTLVEVETDKAVVELPSPRAGLILELHHAEGDIVKVGEVLVTIREEGATRAEPSKGAETRSEAGGAGRRSTAVVGELEEAGEADDEGEAAERPRGPADASIEPASAAVEDSRPLAAPATRHLAREMGIDIGLVPGTGPHGRVLQDDVRRFAARSRGPAEKPIERKAPAESDAWGGIERVPLRGVRRTVARNMAKAISIIPHVTHTDEADVTELVRIHEKQKPIAAKQGVHLTYLPFIAKAVVAGLKQFPAMNSSLDDEREEIVIKGYYNLGISVNTPDGLIVPVLKNADKKGILELAAELEDLLKKAIKRKIDLRDLKGGTFTITNIGSIGGIYSTPIVSHPEVAILATGRIQERPLVRQGTVAVGRILPLSLSFDHRVIDGATAASFLNWVKERLEDPALLLF